MAFGASNISLGAATGLQVGDAYGGGIVFWLDGNGGGMVSATSPLPADPNLGRWTIFTDVPGASGTAIGTGYQNNLDIRAAGTCQAVNYVFDSTINGYSDWFLPSQGELQEVHNTVRQLMTYPTDNLYWSSTEVSASQAQALRPWNGGFQGYAKGAALYCLPVRRFLSEIPPFVGQYTQGGIVFYAANNLALVASLTTSTTTAQWGCAYQQFLNPPSIQDNTLGGGSPNTYTLVRDCATANIAAKRARAYTDGVYNDWYLPNMAELQTLNAVVGTNPGGLGNLANLIVNVRYNSSIEATSGMSFGIDVTATGQTTAYINKGDYNYWKPIRKFQY